MEHWLLIGQVAARSGLESQGASALRGTRHPCPTPLAATLGFVPLPRAYFVFLGGVTMTYLVLVELVKRRLMRRLPGMGRVTPAAKSVTPAS